MEEKCAAFLFLIVIMSATPTSAPTLKAIL
jgi:hypothetical protein